MIYRKLSLGSKLRKTLLAIFSATFLLLVFSVVMKLKERSRYDTPGEPSHIAVSQIVREVWPFIVLVPVWLFFLLAWPRIRLRNIYRRTPALQGEVHSEVSNEGFFVQLSTGSSSRTSWSDMKSWHEMDGLVLLIHPTKIFQIVNINHMSDGERSEFRALVAEKLQKT